MQANLKFLQLLAFHKWVSSVFEIMWLLYVYAHEVLSQKTARLHQNSYLFCSLGNN